MVKGNFPFGQPLRIVEQTDVTPKPVFVLGVYASAVHARWIGPDGRDVVKALAVASEPDIFWRGEGAKEIVEQISIPSALGKLTAADERFNGPSGIALDRCFLRLLGFKREDAWLCDLVPHSCVNPAQREAINRAYVPVAAEYGLPLPNIPSVPEMLADHERRRMIVEELHSSRAGLLMLLGDQPIKWFLRFFDGRWGRLADFGTKLETYGRRHHVRIDGHDLEVLPLAHPRQVARLGSSSSAWHESHQAWLQRRS